MLTRYLSIKKKAREGEGKKFSALSESKNMYNIVLVVVRHGVYGLHYAFACVCVYLCARNKGRRAK